MTRILALLAASAVLLPAQDWARQQLEKSPRHGEWVTVRHEGRSVETFVVYPASRGKTPVVLIIHEIFGLTDWVQELADEVAAAGYIAVAPDLLSGMGPNGGRTSSFDPANVTEAVSHLDANQVTADLNSVADYALKLPAAQRKLFVAGFCWGGSQTFRFATNRQELSGAFVFYGSAPMKADQPGTPDAEALGRIKAPVYGFYAGNDARIGATIPATESAMKQLGKKYEPVTYDGANHGFMRLGEAPDVTEGNKKAREQAWERWKKLLGGS